MSTNKFTWKGDQDSDLTGCHNKDTEGGLRYKVDGKQNPEDCVDKCRGMGYLYSGVNNGGDCYCGDNYQGDLIEDSNCNTICDNDTNQYCGGVTEKGSIQTYSNYPITPLGYTTLSQINNTDGLKLTAFNQNDCMVKTIQHGKQFMAFEAQGEGEIEVVDASFGANCPWKTWNRENEKSGNPVRHLPSITKEVKRIMDGMKGTINMRANLLEVADLQGRDMQKQAIPNCNTAEFILLYKCNGVEQPRIKVRNGESFTLNCVKDGECYAVGELGELLNDTYPNSNTYDKIVVTSKDSPIVNQTRVPGQQNYQLYKIPNVSDKTDVSAIKNVVDNLKTQRDDLNTKIKNSKVILGLIKDDDLDMTDSLTDQLRAKELYNRLAQEEESLKELDEMSEKVSLYQTTNEAVASEKQLYSRMIEDTQDDLNVRRDSINNIDTEINFLNDRIKNENKREKTNEKLIKILRQIMYVVIVLSVVSFVYYGLVSGLGMGLYKNISNNNNISGGKPSKNNNNNNITY
jgi:hypothetical protein